VAEQDHFLDDIPAYAIGALDANERDRLESHLSGCPVCLAELRAYQEVISAVSLTAPLAEPPARLKQNLMKQIQPQVRPAIQLKPKTGAGFWDFLRNRLHPSPALTLGAALMIVVLLASNLLLWKQVNDYSAMQRHGFSSVILNGTTKAPDARGMIVYTMDGNSGFLVVNGLKALPSDHQYQLWLVKSGKRVSGGVFSVDPGGYQVLEVKSSSLLTTYDSFGITIEPWGGSPGPTGDKVLGGKF
jgi:anti-sigma-K factor RskA